MSAITTLTITASRNCISVKITKLIESQKHCQKT